MKRTSLKLVLWKCGIGVMAGGWLASANAQPTFTAITIENPTPDVVATFGVAVAGVGDVNGDGVPDVLVGADQQDVGGVEGQGRASVFGGADGSLLRIIENPMTQSGRFGFAVAGVGDVNGDGVPDLLIGALEQDVGGNTNQGQAFVFSGANGSLLHALTTPIPQTDALFGYAVTGVGDVNGDGKPDVLVGAPGVGVNDQGQAFVFSGASGSLLHTLDNPTPQADAFFGLAVAGTGDVNGDGSRDLLVGAPNEDVGANFNQGRAFVFSGATGSLLFSLDDPTPQADNLFGSALAGVSDVNGDGVSDLLVAAHAKDVGGNHNQGQTFVFSGVDGSLVHTLNHPQSQPEAVFGEALAGTGDVNNDGIPDLLVTAPNLVGLGQVFVFSGANATLLATLDSPTSLDSDFGHAVAGVGDVNGDGIPDLVVGARGEKVGGNVSQGRAFLFVSNIEVVVDILSASVNPKNHGVIEVAILTNSEFDATSVNPLSVKFGPAGATEVHGKGHLVDVDRDGDTDLLLHFRTEETGIVCGDTQASLVGKTFAGEPIHGSDSFITIGCP